MISTMKLPLKSAAKIRITEPMSGIAEIRLRAGRPSVCVNILGDMRICSDPF